MIATERIVTDARCGALPATATQRAICRVIDGLPVDGLEHGLGDVTGYVTSPPRPPRCVVLLAGIRSGKSLIAAAAAVRAALTADLSGVRRSETVRSAVVSLDIDRARAVVEHVHGLASTPLLRPLISPSAMGAVVRRGDGRTVEIRVEAASRDGGTLVARWLAGVVYDEAPRMRGRSDGGVIALEDLRRAVAGRLRPGAQELIVGSPAGPRGAVYDIVRAWEADGSRQTPDLVVIRADGRAMNPSWWSEERCAALAATDPVAYETDVLGHWGAAEEALLSPASIDACMTTDVPPPDGVVVAAMDPATRRDSWSLVVASANGTRVAVHAVRTWRGSRLAPLDPRAVLRAIAAECAAWGTDTVWSDQASADALAALGADAGIGVVSVATTAARTRVRASRLRAWLDARRIVLIEDQVLRRDLLGLRRRVVAGGEWSVELPRTGDGHCDTASALLLAADVLGSPHEERVPEPETPEAAMRRMVREAAAAERAPLPWDVLG